MSHVFFFPPKSQSRLVMDFLSVKRLKRKESKEYAKSRRANNVEFHCGTLR
jgi:hypothetical protein